MTFFEAIASGFRNYAKFSGRASRSEFWYWMLFDFLVMFLADIGNAVLHARSPVQDHHFGPVEIAAFAILFLPGCAVSARRLHDIGRSGWWQLIGGAAIVRDVLSILRIDIGETVNEVLVALTVAGSLVFIYWACRKGPLDKNAFGLPAPGTKKPSPPRTAGFYIIRGLIITACIVVLVVGVVIKDAVTLPPVLGHAMMGDAELTAAAIVDGADVDTAGSLNDWTGLHEAAFDDDAKVAGALIGLGADLDRQSKSLGDTPLMIAAQRGSLKVAALLLDSGAKLDIKNTEGETALAQAGKHADVADLLRTTEALRQAPPAIPLDKPNRNPAALRFWALKTALHGMTLGFDDYKERLAESRKNFSAAGWADFHKVLKERKILRDIIHSQQLVSVSPTNIPTVIMESTAGGKYQCAVKVPLVMTVRTFKPRYSSNVDVTMMIERDGSRPDGLNIVQWQLADSAASPAEISAPASITGASGPRAETLDKPVMDHDQVFAWTSLAVLDALALDYRNYDAHLQAASAHFTPAGLEELKAALKNAGLPDLLTVNSLSILPEPKETPLLINEGVTDGRYSWRVRMQLNLNYKSGTSQAAPEPWTLEVVVQRTNDAADGVAIAHWVSQPDKPK